MELNGIGLIFSETRGDCETEFVRAMLADPRAGFFMAERIGLDAQHFQVHPDMRIAFCACMVLPDDQIRLAKLALQQELYPLASGIEKFIEPWIGANEFVRSIALSLYGRKLIRLHCAERDSREHFKHAKIILERALA